MSLNSVLLCAALALVLTACGDYKEDVSPREYKVSGIDKRIQIQVECLGGVTYYRTGRGESIAPKFRPDGRIETC
ncbi:hypothetical protein [Methylobacillus sp.]|uniref:hypothetical protein n=1 Tax=Methylobacillus sp. TaxID=56818 RepID=UPI0012C5E77B|nr:hypothetical protein [Methylobacillus sp.]MPS48512.1 hypothetical protein [Methylobacillus sp.]